jgi:hypothetical protein
MKKTTIAAALLMIISTCSFAGVTKDGEKDKDKTKGESKASISGSTKDEVYNLLYRSNTPGKVLVSIRDAKGKLILVDYIRNKDGFMRPYNFSTLTEGNYLVEVTDHNGKMSMPVEHKSHEVKNSIKADVKALSNDRKYELLMLGNLSKGVKVTIYNKYDKVIFTEVITMPGGFSKVYDLTKVEDREVTFEVRSEKKIILTERF